MGAPPASGPFALLRATAKAVRAAPLAVVLNGVKHPDSIGQVACLRCVAAGEGLRFAPRYMGAALESGPFALLRATAKAVRAGVEGGGWLHPPDCAVPASAGMSTNRAVCISDHPTRTTNQPVTDPLKTLST